MWFLFPDRSIDIIFVHSTHWPFLLIICVRNRKGTSYHRPSCLWWHFLMEDAIAKQRQFTFIGHNINIFHPKWTDTCLLYISSFQPFFWMWFYRLEWWSWAQFFGWKLISMFARLYYSSHWVRVWVRSIWHLKLGIQIHRMYSAVLRLFCILFCIFFCDAKQCCVRITITHRANTTGFLLLSFFFGCYFSSFPRFTDNKVYIRCFRIWMCSEWVFGKPTYTQLLIIYRNLMISHPSAHTFYRLSQPASH